jgi:hypothetical protein
MGRKTCTTSFEALSNKIGNICHSSSDSSSILEGIALRGEGNGNRDEGRLGERQAECVVDEKYAIFRYRFLQKKISCVRGNQNSWHSTHHNKSFCGLERAPSSPLEV